MHAFIALSLPDRVMVVPDDGIVLHAFAKVAISPVNAKVLLKYF
jgi:hypothetical protein